MSFRNCHREMAHWGEAPSANMDASSQPFWAQWITGDIIGTITDSSGSAIANTKVILRSLET